MAFTNCMINECVVESLIQYRESGTFIGYRGVWIKASWDERFEMWSITTF